MPHWAKVAGTGSQQITTSLVVVELPIIR